MAIYWTLFSIAVVGVLSPTRLTPKHSLFIWAIIGVLFTLTIGLRYQIGGDWATYLSKVTEASGQTLPESLSSGAPLYWLLNWVGSHIGGGIYLVNLICGAVFMTGLIVFARASTWPWLAFFAAVPYLLIVVVMGYSRQGAAIGFELLGLVQLIRGQRIGFVSMILTGALFHKTAVVLLPLAAFGGTERRFWAFVWVGGTGAIAFFVLLLDRFQTLWGNYVDAGMQSSGAGIRITMTALPALLLIIFRRRLNDDVGEQRLWSWLSIASLCCLALLLIMPSGSTMVDRMALYLIPVQLYVFSRLPRLGGTMLARTLIVTTIIVYYGVVQYTWLNFASNAQNWLPYRFALLS